MTVRDFFKERMDKSFFSVGMMTVSDRSDLEYWLSRTPSERLSALEFLRGCAFGYGDSPPRLQRILEITQRQRG